ncbi:amidohydrolase family protein [Microbacterium sp.]|uniref:amidohydrolase family protein n=1 Tax=Microbacterium sp. TaxID=51671 RepID=UPI003C7904DB
MGILIKNGRVTVGDAAGTVHERADVLVRDGLIAAVGPDLVAAEGDEIIDASRSLVLPGFVDAHMHSNEGFEMGRYDNLPLELWLAEVYPPTGSPALTWRDHYLRAMLVGIVSVRSGVTMLQDDVISMAFDPNAVDATATAYRDLGLRANITSSMWDESFTGSLPFVSDLLSPELATEFSAPTRLDWRDQLDLYRDQVARWNGRDADGHDAAGEDGIRIILGPCGPQRCTDRLLEEVAAISAADDVPIHCHVLETRTQAVTGQVHYGRTLVERLRDLGALTSRLTMNHAIWLTPHDIELMGEAQCAITHNPLANLKLGSGTAPVRRLLAAGVTVALGCDGVASADTADIFAAIKLASMVHKVGTTDYREWIGAEDVYRMVTLGGARSAGLQDRIGTIEVGRDADIILLDRDDWGFLPLHDERRQLAFSVGSEAVQTSIVRGRVVLRDRRLALVDEDALRAEIAEAAERFRRDVTPELSRGAAIVRPALDEMYARAMAWGPLPLPVGNPRFDGPF